MDYHLENVSCGIGGEGMIKVGPLQSDPQDHREGPE
jgi:hypothetical protein